MIKTLDSPYASLSPTPAAVVMKKKRKKNWSIVQIHHGLRKCVTKLVDSLPRKALVKYHLAMDNYFFQPAVIEI
jgi:hypothetical protein